MTGHENHFSFRRLGLHLSDDVDARAVRQAEIREYQIKLLLTQDHTRLRNVGCGQDLKSLVRKKQTQRVCHADVVIDDQNAFALTLVHELITRLQAILQLAYTVAEQTVKSSAESKKAETFSATAGFSANRRAWTFAN